MFTPTVFNLVELLDRTFELVFGSVSVAASVDIGEQLFQIGFGGIGEPEVGWGEFGQQCLERLYLAFLLNVADSLCCLMVDKLLYRSVVLAVDGIFEVLEAAFDIDIAGGGHSGSSHPE